MRFRFIYPACFLLLAALAAYSLAADSNLILPQGCCVKSLLKLPELPDNLSAPVSVRLSPTGQAEILYYNHLFYLRDDPAISTASYAGSELSGFCRIDLQTRVLLVGKQLLFFRNKVCVRRIGLPYEKMQIVRAGEGACYLYGGEGASTNVVLKIFASGEIYSFLEATEPVSAVAGNEHVFFSAVGSAVYTIGDDQNLLPFFKTESPVSNLALGSDGTLFYTTKDGLGCVEKSGCGLVFLKDEVLALDCREDQLLVLLSNGQVLLFKPINGFSGMVRDIASSVRQIPDF